MVREENVDPSISWLLLYVECAGPRVTVPRSLRWAGCGAVSMSASTATLVRLLSPECEPQNIAAYDQPKPPQASLP